MSKGIQFTPESLKRASNVCAQLTSLLSPVSEEERARLAKCNGADEMYSDPVGAIVEEEAIRQAPPAFLAIAAFLGEAVEGLQNALKIQEAKLDLILKWVTESGLDITKANQETQDLLKAFMEETPAESFRAPAAYVREPLTKAALGGDNRQLKAPKSFYITKLQELAEQGKVSPVDVSRFESSNRISDELKDFIELEWKKANS
jgi:hypothetical protein